MNAGDDPELKQEGLKCMKEARVLAEDAKEDQKVPLVAETR